MMDAENEVLDTELPTSADQYLNVYRIERRYGGPEEGGWWYDAGEPIGVSVKFEGGWDKSVIESVRACFRAEFPNQGNRYSMAPRGEDYQIDIEDQPAKAWPYQQPHYE